ncbi:MAG: pseudouridine synthase [Spirosomataceae bacterium]
MTLDYFICWKPFGMLSQFTKEGEHTTLADLPFRFPRDVYPVGRLDADSEGLLILTNDNYLKTKLLEPKFGHTKTYWVQVEGEITQEAIRQLSQGVVIRIKGKEHRTNQAKVEKIEEPNVPPRTPPVRFRKEIPTSWISIQIGEGKNRQVRRMTAAVGFPTLRLLRGSIENVSLLQLKPMEVKQLLAEEMYELVKLNKRFS